MADSEMQAVGYITPGPIKTEHSLLDIDLDKPQLLPSSSPGGATSSSSATKTNGGGDGHGKNHIISDYDMIVHIKAVAVNTIDVRMRNGKPPPIGEPFRVLGYDTSGVVESCGVEATNKGFKVGDYVYYSGCVSRQGNNSEYHLVDSRLVGYKPKNVSHGVAAAFPMSSIVAWEMLFTKLHLHLLSKEDLVDSENGNDNELIILIVGGATGIGSMAIQLLRVLAPTITIIATASRPVAKDWVRDLGAHYILDERWPLKKQIDALNLGRQPQFVFSTVNNTQNHLDDIVQCIAPYGALGVVDDGGNMEFLDVVVLKKKSITIHWVYAFTRSLYNHDIQKVSYILNEVSKLIESKKIKSIVNEIAGQIDADTLKKVHGQIERNDIPYGQIVLQGFPLD